jgi:hypothetical protein
MEPYLIRITKSSDFDGTTPITLTRSDLAVAGQRIYTASVSGPAGLIGADILGLFAPESTKLIGVSFSSFNPLSVVRVIDALGRVREEVNLTGSVQYVITYSGDRLAVLTRESNAGGQARAVELTLVVNELHERDHMQWALAHPPELVHTRFRIIRPQGNFAGQNTLPLWFPTFIWSEASGFLEAVDIASNGPIPIASLSPFLRQYGSLISIRYANSQGDGKLTLVNGHNRATWDAQTTLTDMRWSSVQYAAHDDLLLLTASVNAGVGTLVCDIEVVRVEPGDRLRGRFAAAFGVGQNL